AARLARYGAPHRSQHVRRLAAASRRIDQPRPERRHGVGAESAGSRSGSRPVSERPRLMADDETIDAALEDAKEERDDAFFASLGIDRILYFFDVRNSIAHARIPARRDPNTVPWRLWGARNIGGRIRSLGQHPTNTTVFYAGSAQGGVF